MGCFLTLLAFIFLLPFILIALAIIYPIMWARKRSGVSKDQILEQWQVLIENGSGSATDVYDSIAEALEAAEAPGVQWQLKAIRAGGMLTGGNYDGVVVTNSRLKECRIYIFARDYGTGLNTAWFLTIQLGFWKGLMAMGILKTGDPRAIVRYFDIPQQLELSAYVTVVHGAAKGAVGALMTKLEQDFSKVNTRSKGFLEVW